MHGPYGSNFKWFISGLIAVALFATKLFCPEKHHRPCKVRTSDAVSGRSAGL